ncbi:TetR/AcrR family transcriptional regulator [Nocardioides sp. 503]|uniref:TetR/AcrR family transcriptional regulator n=1 Tax=Nocardioides sp. 503 TaxID=2508326 RepID=UPI00106F3624|nr:TetR/AcrR family transcriptional regulator [Nocardioides sp. 503]
MMSTSDEQTAPKRAYNADSRRERAEQERSDTRRRVLAAARTRFLADGYGATKMLDIAAEAGVALASVYRAGGSKSDLAQDLLAMAVTGRDTVEPSAVAGTALTALPPPSYPQIAATPEPEEQVRMIADRVVDVLERIGPLWGVLRDAAAVDAGAAEAMRVGAERREASFVVAVGMLPAERLRGGPEECIDMLWGLTTPELYGVLRVDRGWSEARYREWLRRALAFQLLTP